jgi:hypothetical protein
MKIWQFIIPIVVVLVVLFQKFQTKNPDEQRAQTMAPQQPIVFPAELPQGERVEPVERRDIKNYYVVFDGSGSMTDIKCSGSQKKIDVAKVAVKEFASQIPKNANVGLAVFDGSGLSERLPLGQENHDKFKEQVEAVRANGGTPIRSAITLGSEKLAKQAALQMGYGEYHLVVVTDGEADDGEDPQPIVNSILKGSPILIHTVGFCIGTQHSLNQPGRVLYQSADNPEELRLGLKDVLAEATTFNIDEFKTSQ